MPGLGRYFSHCRICENTSRWIKELARARLHLELNSDPEQVTPHSFGKARAKERSEYRRCEKRSEEIPELIRSSVSAERAELLLTQSEQMLEDLRAEHAESVRKRTVS